MCDRTDKRNVYKQDDRYYVREIKTCTCVEMDGDQFIIECNIRERGKRLYSCSENPEYIQKVLDSKKLWLSEEAREQVNAEIGDFKKKVDSFGDDSCIKVDIQSCDTLIIYRHREKNRFDFLLKIGQAPGVLGETYVLTVDMDETLDVLFSLVNDSLISDDRAAEILKHSTEETIWENPLFEAARINGDLYMQKLLKMYYGIIDEEDCRWLSDNVFEMELLSPVPEEYNRGYYVVSEGIQQDLLNNSGYRIFHRPYFAMPGNTHSAWTLNPYTRYAVDYAPVNEKTITFEEFLDLIGYRAKE